MRIVLIGANGNVGTEVALRLATRPGIVLVPVSRTRGGSAYLRYRGVRCVHADIADPSRAQRILKDASVIASLALPHGDPARARKANRCILDSMLKYAPDDAAIVFFSTLAVVGEYDVSKARFAVTQYGRAKKAAERYFLNQAKRLGRRAYAVRLGHVIGDYQPLSRLIRRGVANVPVTVVDQNRASNVVHTAMVTELLRLLGENPHYKAGCYDLVNNPNWTWREVYEFEAKNTPSRDGQLEISSSGIGAPSKRKPSLLRSLLGAALRARLVTENAPRVLELLPLRFEEMARVIYLRQLVYNSIGSGEAESNLNPAFYWPQLGQNMAPGIDQTLSLLSKWPLLEGPESWPPDLNI